MNIGNVIERIELERDAILDIAENDRNLDADNPVVDRLYKVEENLMDIVSELLELSDAITEFTNKSVDIIDLMERFSANTTKDNKAKRVS